MTKKVFKNNLRIFWIDFLEGRIESVPKHWQEYSILKGLVTKLKRAPAWEHAPGYYVVELDEREIRAILNIASEALGAPEDNDGVPEDFVETEPKVLQEGMDFHIEG